MLSPPQSAKWRYIHDVYAAAGDAPSSPDRGGREGSRTRWPIDKRRLFPDGVHTQIKRAYELSVCLERRRLMQPDYRVGGCARLIGAILDGIVAGELTGRLRCVLFSFHTVEIS